MISYNNIVVVFVGIHTCSTCLMLPLSTCLHSKNEKYPVSRNNHRTRQWETTKILCNTTFIKIIILNDIIALSRPRCNLFCYSYTYSLLSTRILHAPVHLHTHERTGLWVELYFVGVGGLFWYNLIRICNTISLYF